MTIESCYFNHSLKYELKFALSISKLTFMYSLRCLMKQMVHDLDLRYIFYLVFIILVSINIHQHPAGFIISVCFVISFFYWVLKCLNQVP